MALWSFAWPRWPAHHSAWPHERSSQTAPAGTAIGASNFLDETTENFFVQAIFPSIFWQHPRYYQDGRGTFWGRAGYAVSRTAVTHSDSGHTRFNLSELAGAAAAAALSNTYHPASDRTVTNTMETWASMMGWDTVSNMLKEFWPDIRRKVHQKREKE